MRAEMDSKYLKKTIALAAAALERGESPFSTVLVKGGKVLAEVTNQTIAEDNPTAHAEIVAIREACRVHGSKAVARSTIYCSCEPCPMCLSAMFYSQVARVVFAATIEDSIRFGSGDPSLSARWLNDQGRLNIELIQGTGRDAMVSLFEKCVEKYGHL